MTFNPLNNGPHTLTPAASLQSLKPTCYAIYYDITMSIRRKMKWVSHVIHMRGKLKCLAQPRTSHEGTEEEQRYSSTFSLTSTVDGCGWSTPRPGRITPEQETGYPLCWRLSGRQGRTGRVRKISPLPGFDPLTVHPVASRSTDSAILTHDVGTAPKIIRP